MKALIITSTEQKNNVSKLTLQIRLALASLSNCKFGVRIEFFFLNEGGQITVLVHTFLQRHILLRACSTQQSWPCFPERLVSQGKISDEMSTPTEIFFSGRRFPPPRAKHARFSSPWLNAPFRAQATTTTILLPFPGGGAKRNNRRRAALWVRDSASDTQSAINYNCWPI